MSLVVYFISFFLFWHQTGQYIVRITERTGLMLSTNILTCIFYVIFQSQCEHKIALEPEFIEKRLLRAGKIIRTQFLAKRYLKLTRRLFSSCNQAYSLCMPGSFCFEAFKHFLYSNAVTRTTSYGFAECKSFKRRKLFSLLCFYYKGEVDLFLKFPCRTKKTYGCMNNWKIVYI